MVAYHMPQRPDIDQRHKNQCAMNLILSSVDDDSMEQIQDLETAHDLWNRLNQIRGTCDDYHARDVLKEFATSTKKPDETIMEYWRRKQDLLFNAIGAGMQMPDHQAATHILGRLPEEYEIFRRLQNSQALDFSFSNLKRMLLAEEAKMKSAQTDYEGIASYADRRSKPCKRGQQLSRQGRQEKGDLNHERKDLGHHQHLRMIPGRKIHEREAIVHQVSNATDAIFWDIYEGIVLLTETMLSSRQQKKMKAP